MMQNVRPCGCAARLVVAAWMACCLCLSALGPGRASAADSPVVFSDRFSGKLGEGWLWLRENPAAWRLAENALEIRVEPGVAQTVKNALLRPAPDRLKGRYAIDVTVTNLAAPKQQYEQAGITWYTDGKPVFKLVKELIDGKLYIIPGRKPLECNTVELRLIVSADRFTAQYRPEAKGDFLTAAEGKLTPGANEQVSIQCYQGPPDAEHWIRFENFRITRLDDELTRPETQ